MLKAAIVVAAQLGLMHRSCVGAFLTEINEHKAQRCAHDYRVIFFIVFVGSVRLVCMFSHLFAFGLRAYYATYPAKHPNPVNSQLLKSKQ